MLITKWKSVLTLAQSLPNSFFVAFALSLDFCLRKGSVDAIVGIVVNNKNTGRVLDHICDFVFMSDKKTSSIVIAVTCF